MHDPAGHTVMMALVLGFRREFCPGKSSGIIERCAQHTLSLLTGSYDVSVGEYKSSRSIYHKASSVVRGAGFSVKRPGSCSPAEPLQPSEECSDNV